MTTNGPAALSGDLDAWRDLHLALHTSAALQTSIRHADAKASGLLGALAGLAATAAEFVPSVLHAPDAVTHATALVLSVAFLGGLAATVWHLVLALVPRLAGPSGHNRFAFPNLAALGRRPTAADTQRLRDEAWDLVSVLARVAITKHKHLRRSLPGLAAATLAASSLQILNAINLPIT